MALEVLVLAEISKIMDGCLPMMCSEKETFGVYMEEFLSDTRAKGVLYEHPLFSRRVQCDGAGGIPTTRMSGQGFYAPWLLFFVYSVERWPFLTD